MQSTVYAGRPTWSRLPEKWLVAVLPTLKTIDGHHYYAFGSYQLNINKLFLWCFCNGSKSIFGSIQQQTCCPPCHKVFWLQIYLKGLISANKPRNFILSDLSPRCDRKCIMLVDRYSWSWLPEKGYTVWWFFTWRLDRNTVLHSRFIPNEHEQIRDVRCFCNYFLDFLDFSVQVHFATLDIDVNVLPTQKAFANPSQTLLSIIPMLTGLSKCEHCNQNCQTVFGGSCN